TRSRRQPHGGAEKTAHAEHIEHRAGPEGGDGGAETEGHGRYRLQPTLEDRVAELGDPARVPHRLGTEDGADDRERHKRSQADRYEREHRQRAGAEEAELRVT